MRFFTANLIAQAYLSEDDPPYESPRDFFHRQKPSTKPGTVTEWEVRQRGIDNSQYFQGAGVYGTDWDECFVGIGDNPHEALDDALDNAAQSGWNVNTNQIVNDEPTEPSVSGMRDEQAARERPAREHGEDDSAYDERCAESDEEADQGWEDCFFYTVLYLKGTPPDDGPIPHDPLTPRDESLLSEDGDEPPRESPKDFFRRQDRNAGADGPYPDSFPKDLKFKKSSEDDWLERKVKGPKMGNTAYRRPSEVARQRGNWAEREGIRYAIRYHRTNILTYYKDGSVKADVGSWRTTTTRDRLNNFLPQGWEVLLRQGLWYWFNRRWPDEFRERMALLLRSRSRAVRDEEKLYFENGDTIDIDGNLVRDGVILCTRSGVMRPSAQAPEAPTVEPPPVQEGEYQKELDWIQSVREKLANLHRAKRWNSAVENVDKPSKKKTRMNLH